MSVYQCRMCGAPLPVTAEPIVECEYCYSRQPVPSADSEKKQTLFARANRLRLECEFDRAAAVYESIAAEFPEEAEASWGIVLCRYGIEYVDDPATGQKVPTCHRSSYASVLDDKDYQQTMDCASPLARKLYHREAVRIEELRENILAASSREEPYDIFICYKETAEDGGRTLDSVLAQDIYNLLTNKGYRVFFSRISLEDRLGREYEPYIFAALNSAKVMLAVGTCFEHYDAVWVKNEWSRFLKLMEKDSEKYLIPCYKDLDAYDMPKEFRRLQAQDLGKVGAHQDLLRGIEKILGSAKPAPAIVQTTTPDVSALVMRGRFSLEDRDFAKASEYFERALDQNPQDSSAYLGKVLAAHRLTKEEQLESCYGIIRDNKDFLRAVQFAEGELKQQLLAIQNNALKKPLVSQLVSVLYQVRRIAKKQEELQEKYMQAMQCMENAVSAAAYTNASEKFKKLGNYLDSINNAALCLKKAEAARLQSLYEEAQECMDQGNYAVASEKFKNLGNYLDSVNNAALCSEKAEAARLQSLYEEALEFMNHGNYSAALNHFSELGDYANSNARKKECEKRVAEQKRIEEEQAKAEAEHQRIMALYNKAVSTMRNGNTVGEYEQALELFYTLENHLDVSTEKAKCQQVLTRHRWRKSGLCQYCGGTFNGFLTKKCVKCGNRKDY